MQYISCQGILHVCVWMRYCTHASATHRLRRVSLFHALPYVYYVRSDNNTSCAAVVCNPPRCVRNGVHWHSGIYKCARLGCPLAHNNYTGVRTALCVNNGAGAPALRLHARMCRIYVIRAASEDRICGAYCVTCSSGARYASMDMCCKCIRIGSGR